MVITITTWHGRDDALLHLHRGRVPTLGGLADCDNCWLHHWYSCGHGRLSPRSLIVFASNWWCTRGRRVRPKSRLVHPCGGVSRAIGLRVWHAFPFSCRQWRGRHSEGLDFRTGWLRHRASQWRDTDQTVEQLRRKIAGMGMGNG